VQQLLKEVLSLAEGNATWIESAAQHFERLAAQFREDEKAQWELLAAAYRERARTIESVAEKVA
jgi:hypothetical protein